MTANIFNYLIMKIQKNKRRNMEMAILEKSVRFFLITRYMGAMEGYTCRPMNCISCQKEAGLHKSTTLRGSCFVFYKSMGSSKTLANQLISGKFGSSHMPLGKFCSRMRKLYNNRENISKMSFYQLIWISPPSSLQLIACPKPYVGNCHHWVLSRPRSTVGKLS